METALYRLLCPLQDTLDYLDIPRNKHGVVMRVLIIEMQRRQTSFWAWSDSEWVETIAFTRDTFVKQNSRSSAVLGRSEVLAIAYLLCGFGSLFLFPKRRVHRHTLARNVFGKEALNHADQRVYAVVQGWGYAQRSSAWSELDNTLCTALLLNHSPYLEDLTVESLLALRNQVESERMGGFINLLVNVKGIVALRQFKCVCLLEVALSHSATINLPQHGRNVTHPIACFASEKITRKTSSQLMHRKVKCKKERGSPSILLWQFLLPQRMSP